MTYKERESYLGYSTKIGYLDKGGKWRKKNWYMDSKDKTADQKEREEEIR